LAGNNSNRIGAETKGERGRRATVNRRTREEALRAELKAKEYLRQIQLDYDELHKLMLIITALKAKRLTKAQATALNKLDDYTDARFQLEKCAARRDILKAKLDVNFRRLKFCLPELKSIALTDSNGDNPFAQFLDTLVQATKDSTK